MRNARAFFELVVSLRETFSSGLDEASKNVVPLYLLVEEKGTGAPFPIPHPEGCSLDSDKVAQANIFLYHLP